MLNLVLFYNENMVFEGMVKEVEVITKSGPITIMPQHEPYMSKIMCQISYIDQDEKKNVIDILDGFIYTNGKQCFAVTEGEERTIG
ncbi:MAG: hypothetical protein LBB34_02190 [Holosporales bacterium]|jgi:F0F1-type ATP synthase epsilon subunit|nr:hypothetical protein [Holosporales bacterium]